MARRRWNYETIQQVLDGENPFVQVGYSKKSKKHKEGDIWTDARGKTWKQLNGARIQVNEKADVIREMIKPICSVCGQRIDFSCDRLDQKIFPKTGKCFDCLQSEEMVYRVNGTWEEYENLKLLKNKLSILRDFKQKVMESVEFLENDTGRMELVMPTGELMTWNGKSNEKWLIDARNDLVKVDEEIKKVEEELSTLEPKK